MVHLLQGRRLTVLTTGSPILPVRGGPINATINYMAHMSRGKHKPVRGSGQLGPTNMAGMSPAYPALEPLSIFSRGYKELMVWVMLR
jgi:hypothetical protein